MQVRGVDELLAQLRAAADVAAGRAPAARTAAAGARVDFGSALKSALDQVNGAQQQALGLAREFELGAPSASLHDVVLSLQKANIAFQGAVQVRNKLVAAYQEIMNMQV